MVVAGPRPRLGHLDGRGTHQDRKPLGIEPFDLVDDRVVLLTLGPIDLVLVVQARDSFGPVVRKVINPRRL